MDLFSYMLGKKSGGSGGGSGGGENLLDYADGIKDLFDYISFTSKPDFEVSFGAALTKNIASDALDGCFLAAENMKTIKVNCDLSGTFSMIRAFFGSYGESVLEKIDLSGMVQPLAISSLQIAFGRRTKLQEIIGEFDMSNCTNTNSAFQDCAALQTVRFTQGSIKIGLSFGASPNLTGETIQSIIDGLADLTGGTAQTLTLHATVGAKLTDEQKAAASAKNWTISY